MDKINFFRGFIKNWRQVGSITPSSRFLTDKIIKFVDFEKAKIIVELGPGLGCFTEKILEKMKMDSKLLVFEINSNFCEKLRKNNDSRLTVFNVSALDMAYHLKDLRVDYVISGIPLSTLSDGPRHNLLGR